MANEINVELTRVDGLTLMAKADAGQCVDFDAAEAYGGTNGATRPFEAFIMSLAGCTAMDVISILKKMRVEYEKFKIKVTAIRKTEHPKVPEKIFIEYILIGDNIPEESVKKAISLSQEKYCSVSHVVKMANIPVEWKYSIIAVGEEK